MYEEYKIKKEKTMEKSQFTIVNGEDENADTFVPEENKISEVKTYMDEEGRMVAGHYPINGSDPSFLGSFMVQTNMGPIRMNIEFPEDSTLQECFDSFDELAKKTLEDAQNEVKDRNRIVTPDQFKGGNFKL